jgi:hypothetical protein
MMQTWPSFLSLVPLLDKTRLGQAEIANARHSLSSRISDTSRSVAYVALPPGDLPGGMSAATPELSTAGWGIALSADMIAREIKAGPNCSL